MLRRLLLLLTLALASGRPAYATHIVGGEFSMQRVAANTFDIKLTLYFDAINGSVGAIDPGVRCYINAKADPRFRPIQIEMPLDPAEVFVTYSNPDCEFVAGAVKTRILSYHDRVMLDETLFTDSAGYYLVYERCCRNANILNILDPGAVGQAFYLEFPPMRVGGNRFINSSPTLFRPLSDFACVNQPFFFDFSGRDPDGDSLRYSLVPPYVGNTTAMDPGAYPQAPALNIPAPYATVIWAPGYSDAIQITSSPQNGNPPQPLQIDSLTGYLRMRPDRQGLFVFAIECREYRNGRYLGKVRREFQVVVKDCPNNTPPHIALQDTGGRILQENDTLVVQTVIGGSCTELAAIDTLPDTEVFTLASFDLPAGVRVVQSRGATDNTRFVTQLCIDDCLAPDTIRFAHITLNVRDNFCAIPARDSLHFILKLLPAPPRVNTLGLNLIQRALHDTVNLAGGSALDTVRLGNGPAGLTVLVSDSANPVHARASVSPPLPGGITLDSAGSLRRRVYTLNFNVPCTIDTTVVYTLTVIGSTTHCGVTSIDTVSVPFRPFLNYPILGLALSDSGGIALNTGSEIDLSPGQYLDLTATSTLDPSGPVAFTPLSGYAPALGGISADSGTVPFSAHLRWQVLCSDVAALAGAGDTFSITFSNRSVECRSLPHQSVGLRVRLLDPAGGEPLVNNILTLKADDKNDTFTFKEPKPQANCQGGFEGVQVYNRWGRRVFASNDINFAWRPDEARAAMYFYHLAYQGRVFKGWLEVTE